MNHLLENINFLSDKLTDLHFYFTNVVPTISYHKQTDEVINSGHELINILYKFGDSFNPKTIDLATLAVINLITTLDLQRVYLENESSVTGVSSLTTKQRETLLTDLNFYLRNIIQEIIVRESLDELDL